MLSFFIFHPTRNKYRITCSNTKMSPLTLPVQYYMHLKHFVLWVVLPLVGALGPWAIRQIAGVDCLAGESTSSLQVLHNSSAASAGNLASLTPKSDRDRCPLVNGLAVNQCAGRACERCLPHCRGDGVSSLPGLDRCCEQSPVGRGLS